MHILQTVYFRCRRNYITANQIYGEKSFLVESGDGNFFPNIIGSQLYFSHLLTRSQGRDSSLTDASNFGIES